VANILVVDDEQKMVTLLKSALEHQGHTVTGVHGGAEALDLVRGGGFTVVLTDLKMEPVDGMAVIGGAKAFDPDLQVIVLTAYGDVDTAVQAMQAGAFDYLTKPINFQEVAQVVAKAEDATRLQAENRTLKQAVAAEAARQDLVGEATATKQLCDLIDRVAPSEATVLIRGESGSGKEVVARTVHYRSARADGPFVAFNCAAIAESLLESELFGYRQGAFTGADTDREGLFETARGGTVFLDEIGEAPLSVQAKLLRVLEERKINRVGDPVERDIDVRVIAATNRPLEDAISQGGFREDLYYRLVVFPLDVPPLRERTDDLPLLVGHFLQKLGRRQDKLPAASVNRLRAHGWPGNVRELRNLIERAHILAGREDIQDAHIVLDSPRSRTADVDGDLNLDSQQRRLIRVAVQRAGGNKSQAADMLGITRRTLYSRLKLLGMEEEFAD